MQIIPNGMMLDQSINYNTNVLSPINQQNQVSINMTSYMSNTSNGGFSI